jgi:hypothetical protein
MLAIVLAAIACDRILQAAATEPSSRGHSWSLALMAGSSIFMTVIALRNDPKLLPFPVAHAPLRHRQAT